MTIITQEDRKLLQDRCLKGCFEKLSAIGNESLLAFILQYVKHCNPARIFVKTDSEEDKLYIRNKAVEQGEETPLATKGHTIHFDGILDLARDKNSTKYLTSSEINLDPSLNIIDKAEGLKEIQNNLASSMNGKEMFICFFCLGPLDSPFTILACQITDSAYVAHSENILYRSGYEDFKRKGKAAEFFRFVHSAGALENGVSSQTGKRRIYIDLDENIVYSTNTQYAGNTVGLKKLALRLAIKKSYKEKWLAEHMFIMGVKGARGKRYFTGAFPSACGKTSTAMIPGETIIGDDIAYLRNLNGKVRAVNVECGIFGIIQDVNPKNDPVIWQALTTEGEVIFSNVLFTKEGVPYWLGDGREVPDAGINFSGEWKKGKKDANGTNITHSHKNARYTVSLYALGNVDENLDKKDGVDVSGMIYGGRDSDTTVPVQEAFDWEHGVLTMGAAIESETTAATLGKEGVRQFNLMSNLDFISLPYGKYLDNYLEFAKGLKETPAIFMVNYFLRNKDGKYMNAMEDKRVWIKWMQRRVDAEVDAIKTPTGYIPLYEDLKELFNELLDKEYTGQEYEKQFTLRVSENIDKIDRITAVYNKYDDIPEVLFEVLDSQKERLINAKEAYGEYISPKTLRERDEATKV